MLQVAVHGKNDSYTPLMARKALANELKDLAPALFENAGELKPSESEKVELDIGNTSKNFAKEAATAVAARMPVSLTAKDETNFREIVSKTKALSGRLEGQSVKLNFNGLEFEISETDKVASVVEEFYKNFKTKDKFSKEGKILEVDLEQDGHIGNSFNKAIELAANLFALRTAGLNKYSSVRVCFRGYEFSITAETTLGSFKNDVEDTERNRPSGDFFL